jgi:thiaminase (transcriptional activator TenA)
MSGYTETLVDANRDLWEAMAGHPWVRGLADGTLPEPALVAWAQQCRLFCLLEGRALMSLRWAAPPAELDRLLARLGEDAEREPRQLAETLTSLGAPVVDEEWPVCLGYGAYVQSCAATGLLEGMAAVCSVERSYLDTWSVVLPSVPPESRWRSWVENWTGPAFRELVGGLCSCFDELVGAPSEATAGRLAPIFRNVAKWEVAFWDMAWRQEGWPALKAGS